MILELTKVCTTNICAAEQLYQGTDLVLKLINICTTNICVQQLYQGTDFEEFLSSRWEKQICGNKVD